MELKDFQKIAVNNLSLTFLDLWKTGGSRIPLIFKAPTGAGKTIMMAEFLRCLDGNYQFHEEKAYIWISFGGDESYSQSKKKLYEYFNQGTDMNLKDVTNLNEEKLFKNNIFFINWSKIKGTDKESKKLRKPGEKTEGEFGIFDEYIKKTREEREIVLIVDEAHTETNTALANEVIDLLNPRIIIKVTATPKEDENEIKAMAFDKKAGFVEVFEKDVIESGLIKERLVIQSQEDIDKFKHGKLDEDELMLELAYNKRLELKKYYSELGSDVNPLVLIQLPSDEKEKEEVVANKKQVVLNYLKKKGVKEEEIAIWLSGTGENKKNLDFIEKNNSSQNFMIFKVAPATGWDCPRADVLVMFREITSPTFHTQIIGRIKRMPEGHHYTQRHELNKAYIYTNYNKQHIKNIKETGDGNKLPIYFPKLKKEMVPITIQTTYHHRTDFNTLTPEEKWQRFFKEFLDQYFEATYPTKEFAKNIENIKKKINLNQKEVLNNILIDTDIDGFDNFIAELKQRAKETQFHFSPLDIERLYNLLCFSELKKQERQEAKYNPSRSWSPLKKALNVWFETRTGIEHEDFYKIIVNELLNPNSSLKKAINSGLIEFRKVYDIEIKEKEEKESYNIEIPPKDVGFTDDFEFKECKKNVYEEFYLKQEYKGKDNEEGFIDFLETQNIDWWHKQEDSGRDQFAIEYYDSQEKREGLFYPDFIIKKGSTILILDTKKGNTAKSQQTADKNKALQKWLKGNKSKYAFKLDGGMVEYKHPSWRINRNENYVYEKSDDWTELWN